MSVTKSSSHLGTNKSMLSYRIGIIFCLILLSGNVFAAMSRPPRNNDVNNMADALKYLQDLDSYYASVARPRFGKRASLIQLLKERAATAAQDENDFL